MSYILTYLLYHGLYRRIFLGESINVITLEYKLLNKEVTINLPV